MAKLKKFGSESISMHAPMYHWEKLECFSLSLPVHSSGTRVKIFDNSNFFAAFSISINSTFILTKISRQEFC